MLSPRFITILALVAAAAAHPALLPLGLKKPVTSLSRSELEDVQPWIKFPFFGNVLASFPHFLPNIPEAGPKIETDPKKFQVIINVKEYNKKEFLKVKTKGSFIIIQGAHADVHDKQSSIDSQFIQTYTLPPKVIQSSVTATLTSDGYLVVNAPIGSVINKITYIEKEIPIFESGKPLLEEKVEDTSILSSTSTPTPLILVTPSIELLPPKPNKDEAVNIPYLAHNIPAISLLPPKPTSEENIPALLPPVPTTELLPPKQSIDIDVKEPIVIPVPSGQVENNRVSSTDSEKIEQASGKDVVVPTIISIPLQQQSEGQQIIVGPTYAPILNIQESQSTLTNDATQSDLNVDTPTTETISAFNELHESVSTSNQSGQESATTEQALFYTSNDIYTSAPIQDPDNKLEEIKEKSSIIQLRNEEFDDFTTEISSFQELGAADSASKVLRSDIVLEQENYTGEPEIVKVEEVLNESDSNNEIIAQESLSPATATAETANIIAPTTEQQELLHKDDESELIVESATASVVRSDLNQNEEVNDSPTEINNIPAEFLRSQESQNIIGAENAVEDSTLSENLPSLDIVEVTDKAITGDLLASIANVVYNEELLTNVPQAVVKESEPIISPENVTNQTSEVSEN